MESSSVSVVLKVIYIVNIIPIKILTTFFVQMQKFILKFIGNLKGPRIAKTVLKMKNKVGGLILLDFKHTTQP